MLKSIAVKVIIDKRDHAADMVAYYSKELKRAKAGKGRYPCVPAAEHLLAYYRGKLSAFQGLLEKW